MNPTQVIEYLESNPLDEDFVKILQKNYEFDIYEEGLDSFLFYHYGQLPVKLLKTDFGIRYPSPSNQHLFGSSSRAGPHWAPNLPQDIRRTTTGRLDTSKVFSRRNRYNQTASTIESYQDPDGERGLRFRYYWIKLLGEDTPHGYTTDTEYLIDNTLEDYYLDPAVREEYTDGIDEWWGEYVFAQFDLPYNLPCAALNYPKGGILG